MSVKRILNILSLIVTLFLFFVVNKFIAIVFIFAYILIINYPTILYLIGNHKYSKDKLDEANKYFEKACSCFYAPVKLRILYSYFLIRQGKLERSEEIIKGAKDKNITENEKISLQINYSLIVWKKGELDNAIEVLTELYRDYKTAIIYQNLGYFLILKGDYQRALEFNLEAYGYDASSAGILDNLAQNYFYTGDYDKAIKLYEQLVVKPPVFVTTYYFYALTLLKKNKLEEALQSLKKALDCKFTFLNDITKEEIEEKITEIENRKAAAK